MPDLLADRSPEKGYMCGSQVGKTTMGIAEVLALADLHPRPVRIIYTMHTDTAVQEFSQTRAKPAIQTSQYLAAKLGGVDNVHRKILRRRDGDSIVFFKGAAAGQQALSEPADMVVHDEVDFSRPDVLRLYEDRTAHSDLGWRRFFGTPTLPGFGLAALWEDSTQAEWLVRCPHCRQEFPLAWPDAFAADVDQPYYVCPRGHRITWETIRERGRWVQARPGARYSMYRIPRALLPWWTAARIVEAFRAERFPNLFLNQVMGQPSTSGDLTIDAGVVQACLGDHRNAERCEEPTVLGADPGGSAVTGAVIHICVMRRLPDGKHQVVRMGHVLGWEALSQVMELMNVRVAVVDGAHDPTKAREFCEAFPGRVWLAYYLTQPVKGDEPVKADRRTRTLNLDRTATLDLSASRLLRQQDVLPLCDAATHQEMVLQLTAMQRGQEIANDGLPRAFEVSPS